MNGKKAKQIKQMAKNIVGYTPTAYLGYKKGKYNNIVIEVARGYRKACKGLKKIFKNIAKTKGYEHTTEGLQAFRQEVEQRG